MGEFIDQVDRDKVRFPGDGFYEGDRRFQKG